MLSRIPSVLALVASLALLGCGDLGTGPSAEAPQFRGHNNKQGEQEPCVLIPETTECDEGDQGDDNEDNNENNNENGG